MKRMRPLCGKYSPRVAAGDLFVDIARDLNAQGIKTSKGANWNKGSFQSICQNERYRGIYIYGDVRVADGIPRIVSDDLWYRVQEAMRMKKESSRNPAPCRGRRLSADREAALRALWQLHDGRIWHQ